MLRLVPVLLAAVPLSGCCALSSLWCGPDRSRWVDRSFRTPEAALATFQEAARKDDAETAWRCLSSGYKERSGLTNRLAAEVAWRMIREQNPALHMLGEAVQQPAEILAPDRVRIRLALHGEQADAELVRFPFVFVSYRDPEDGISLPASRILRQPLASVLSFPADEVDGNVQVLFRLLDLPEDLDPEDVELVSVGHEWRIDSFEPVKR